MCVFVSACVCVWGGRALLWLYQVRLLSWLRCVDTHLVSAALLLLPLLVSFGCCCLPLLLLQVCSAVGRLPGCALLCLLCLLLLALLLSLLEFTLGLPLPALCIQIPLPQVPCG